MTDTLPAVKRRNKGEREQYFAFDTHPAIISKDDFERVQKLMSSRREIYVKPQNRQPYPLAKKLICGECGTVFRRKATHGKAYWCCMKHDNSQADCPMKPIAESEIYQAFRRFHYKLKHHPEILNQLVANLQAVRSNKMLWSEDIVSLNRKIAQISSQKQTLTFLKEQGLVDSECRPQATSELQKVLRRLNRDKIPQNEIAEFINELMQNPSVIQTPEIERKASQPAQAEFDRVMNQQPLDEKLAKELAVQSAVDQYENLGDEEYETERIRREFEKAEYGAELLKSCVDKIYRTENAICLRLKNGRKAAAGNSHLGVICSAADSCAASKISWFASH